VATPLRSGARFGVVFINQNGSKWEFQVSTIKNCGISSGTRQIYPPKMCGFSEEGWGMIKSAADLRL